MRAVNTWEHDEIGYALSKQVGTVDALETDYGRLELDPELADALEAALRPILERRHRETAPGPAVPPADLDDSIPHL